MQELFSVKKVYASLVEQNYTTPLNYNLTQKDVLNSIAIMNKKHFKCQWIDYLETYPRVTHEGYYWLCSVYFNKSSSLIDADINFFEQLIENYKQICDDENVSYKITSFIENDMTYDDIVKLVNRKKSTVKKSFYKLPPLQKNNCYYKNKKKYIASNVCENLCKKYFKKTYLNYLEQLYLMLKKNLLSKGIEVNYE